MRINFVGMNLFYSMQINHRKILDGLFAACGVPPEKFKPICSAVDKLDKVSLDTISGTIFVPESMIINRVKIVNLQMSISITGITDILLSI